ncbi:unnamed protein product [Rhizophagus irregularis]|nr:unnamed protein product [Rhizophagus irregularis]
MASNNFVNIDWSTASQHSFIQLGDPTPQNNSNNIIESTTALTVRDILALDIDDIYPFTHFTLHNEDFEPEDVYADDDIEPEEVYDDDDYFTSLVISKELIQLHLLLRLLHLRLMMMILLYL